MTATACPSRPRPRSTPFLARLALIGFLALPVLAPTVGAQATAPKPESAGPYVPTPWVIVEEIMALAGIGPGDYVVDLGSGDGRLVLTAVSRFRARGGFGVDIEESLVRQANESAARAGIADRVQFHVRDLFVTDVSPATVVTLYLLPTSVPKLEPKLLAELKPGARVVSHDYPLPNWPHDRVVKMDVPEKIAISGTPRTTLYLYTVPARVAGSWELTLPRSLAAAPLRLRIAQTASGATAEIESSGRRVPVQAVSVHASDVTLALPAGIAGGTPVTLKGKADGDTIEGGLDGNRWRAVRVRS